MIYEEWNEFKAVNAFYGASRARRTGVLKINHIHEGLSVLQAIKSSEAVMQAFCLHPLFQLDLDFADTVGIPHDYFFSPKAVALAVEYRHIANRWLEPAVTKGDLPNVWHPMIAEMLIADKVQNYKDFITYHYGKHHNSTNLDNYFRIWLDHLGVSFDQYLGLCVVIETDRPAWSHLVRDL